MGKASAKNASMVGANLHCNGSPVAAREKRAVVCLAVVPLLVVHGLPSGGVEGKNVPVIIHALVVPGQVPVFGREVQRQDRGGSVYEVNLGVMIGVVHQPVVVGTSPDDEVGDVRPILSSPRVDEVVLGIRHIYLALRRECRDVLI
jgi:hypothetical protein